ncbi:conserved hypothetical protein [Burkholderia sp. 8Y]|uniref:hypothetical protein n=1 Tax=Burkholderia sp. 8Y TaxID=2653133 RepID=UPI0012F4020A|nr:hypothetical protein [Burkholderia sp. 8Y]VXC83284.1 conserved hypothetical protein [Burkholderia sp. 8Y]
MSKSPDLNKQPMTFMVPDHLAEAFKETVSDFFEKACSGSTPAQRAAEVRAQDSDAGLDSLAHLVDVAESDPVREASSRGF